MLLLTVQPRRLAFRRALSGDMSHSSASAAYVIHLPLGMRESIDGVHRRGLLDPSIADSRGVHQGVAAKIFEGPVGVEGVRIIPGDRVLSPDEITPGNSGGKTR